MTNGNYFIKQGGGLMSSKFVERLDLTTCIWEQEDKPKSPIGKCAFLEIMHLDNDCIGITTESGWTLMLVNQEGVLKLVLVEEKKPLPTWEFDLVDTDGNVLLPSHQSTPAE